MNSIQPIAPEDLYGQPETFSALGREWKLGPPNQATKGMIDVEFAKLARRQLEADWKAGLYTDAEYGQEQSVLREQIRVGHFRTARPGWIGYMSAVEGQELLVLSWLRVNHPDVTLDQVREIFDKHERELTIAMEALEDRFFTLVAGEVPASKRQEMIQMMKFQADQVRAARLQSIPKTIS